MAQINIKTIKKIEKDVMHIHEPVPSTYSVFEKDGKKYVQIDMLGKASREIPGKVSQTIQFDRDTAIYFVNLFIKEFGIK